YSAVLGEADVHAAARQDGKDETRAGPQLGGQHAVLRPVHELHEPCAAQLTDIAHTLEQVRARPVPPEEVYHAVILVERAEAIRSCGLRAAGTILTMSPFMIQDQYV